MTERDLHRLRDVRLTDEEVWDVAEITSMYDLTNRMALALDRRSNEEYHRLDR
jgi:alkylhydroperoxidase family enzyme